MKVANVNVAFLSLVLCQNDVMCFVLGHGFEVKVPDFKIN